ncbi:hypothetical protein GCM10017562_59000 [Streptomyces roseofulvus]
MGEDWSGLRFIPHTEGWVLNGDDVPQWHAEGPRPNTTTGGTPTTGSPHRCARLTAS